VSDGIAILHADRIGSERISLVLSPKKELTNPGSLFPAVIVVHLSVSPAGGSFSFGFFLSLGRS